MSVEALDKRDFHDGLDIFEIVGLVDTRSTERTSPLWYVIEDNRLVFHLHTDLNTAMLVLAQTRTYSIVKGHENFLSDQALSFLLT